MPGRRFSYPSDRYLPKEKQAVDRLRSSFSGRDILVEYPQDFLDILWAIDRAKFQIHITGIKQMSHSRTRKKTEK
jgi:hypothetical protein